MRYWLLAFWCVLCLTPALNLPIGIGNVPLRLDDILSFGVMVWILISRRKPVGGLHSVEWVLLTTAALILLLTLRGSPIAGLSVGAKEYLDVLRPLKFFCVFFLACRLPADEYNKLLRIVPAITVLLGVFALLQFFTPSTSDGVVARVSLIFGRMDESLFRFYLGYRCFATFQSPTDLGYYMALTIVAVVCLSPIPHRLTVGAVALLGLALAGTRTFLFGLPPLLSCYLLLTGGTLRERLKRSASVAVLVAILAAGYVAAFGASASENVSTLQALVLGSRDDESVSGRLQNLVLVAFTFQNAPFTGVISRDMFPNSVDSEYIQTFHRYGFLGLSLTFLLYVFCIRAALRCRKHNRQAGDFCLLAVTLTFVYGITQGALPNTRAGCFLFLIVGGCVAMTPNRRMTF